MDTPISLWLKEGISSGRCGGQPKEGDAGRSVTPETRLSKHRKSQVSLSGPFVSFAAFCENLKVHADGALREASPQTRQGLFRITPCLCASVRCLPEGLLNCYR
jgi:hypothetical protein